MERGKKISKSDRSVSEVVENVWRTVLAKYLLFSGKVVHIK